MKKGDVPFIWILVGLVIIIILIVIAITIAEQSGEKSISILDYIFGSFR